MSEWEESENGIFRFPNMSRCFLNVVFETVKAERKEIIKYACFWDRDLREPK